MNKIKLKDQFLQRISETGIKPPDNIESKLWSLQRIYPDGKKIFLKNGRVKRLFYTIGTPTQKHILTEGYATAASIYESTGICAHVAFNCGNLKAVAEELRKFILIQS